MLTNTHAVAADSAGLFSAARQKKTSVSEQMTKDVHLEIHHEGLFASPFFPGGRMCCCLLLISLAQMMMLQVSALLLLSQDFFNSGD